MTKFISNLKAARHLIRESIDIVRVVSDDLGPAPKETGSDSLWCCPFHSENTPSFGVHGGMRIYHCFGCQVGGDVVSWMQNYHNMHQAAAISTLAAKYGVNISQYERQPTQDELNTIRYQSIMNMAADFCSSQMLSNKQMLDWYRSDTGFSLEQIVDYDVGYSISADALSRHLFKTDPTISQSEIDRLELGRRILWDNAIVYPIRDHDGKATRFYNKPMSPPPDFGGKYVGTSASHPLFTHKLLYGFSNVKKTLRQSGYSIRVVEGQKAAIASGGVAVLGSSIHDEQIELLKEHSVKEVRVLFDGDDTGRASSGKLLYNAHKFGDMSLLIGKLPDDKQPDDIAKIDKLALDFVYNGAVIPIAYYLNSKRSATGVIQSTDKFGIITELREYLLSISDIQLDLTAKYLADELVVNADSVHSYVADLKLTKGGMLNRDAEQSVLRYAILHPEYWSTLRQVIADPRAFTQLSYQYIYTTLNVLHNRARDLSGASSVTVRSLKDEVSISYPQHKELSAVVDETISADQKYEFIDSLTKVCDLHRRRTGVNQSKLFISHLQDLTKPTVDIVSGYRRQLVSSIDIRKDDANTPDQLASSIALELQARSLMTGPIVGHDFSTIIDVDGQKIPCLTGLTLALSGLQKQHQVVISANSGVGKSLLALQMAVSLSVCPQPADRVPVLWIPLEMNTTETTMRVISMLSGVDNNKVQRMNLSNTESIRVNKAINMVSQGLLYIKKPRTGSIDEIFSIIDEYHFKYGIKAVFLDYIQLISSGELDRGLSREEVIGRASKIMKNQVAEALGMASVCIAQQNRSNYKAGEVGSIENVGGSYQISQDADDFLILAAKTQEQMNETKNSNANRLVFVDKRRGGASDIMVEAHLDIVNPCSLRFIEKLTPGELLGLTRGMKQ